MTIPAMNQLKTVFPMMINKYEQFIPNIEGMGVPDKINAIIQYLNRIGKLSNDVVSDWNKVMVWVMDEGLTDSINTKVDDMVSKGTFDDLLNGMFDVINADVTDFKNTVNSDVTDFKNTVNGQVNTLTTQFGTLGNRFTFKGSCLFSSLPTTNVSAGDYWYVTDRTTNYAWNGTSWVDIGNSINIGDNTITLNKLNFFKHTNLFDKNNIVSVTLTKNSTTSTFISDPTLKSIVLKIDPNTTYTISKPIASARFAVYTCPLYPVSGGTITTFTNGSSNTVFTVTSGATDNYLVVYCYNSTIDTLTFDNIVSTLQVEKGNVATSYTDYAVVEWDSFRLNENNFTKKNIIGSDSLKDGVIKVSKLDFASVVNLFDKTNAVTVALIKNASNLTFAGATGVKSVVLACKPSTTYTISKTKSSRFSVYSSVLYPTSGGTITTVVSDDTGVNKVTITTGSSDTYLTIYYYNSSSDTLTESQILDTLQVEVGSVATSYTSYGKFKMKDFISNDSDNVVGLLYDNDQMADKLKKVQKRNDFAWKSYDKAYITFCFDDYRADLGSVYNIFAEYGFPLCCAIPSSTVTNQTVMLLQTIQSNNGEILSHGNFSIPVTSLNYTDKSFMLSEIRDSKKALESYGLIINGWVAPGGGSTQPDLEVYESYQRRYYDYGSNGVATQFNEWRNGLTNGVTASKAVIDSAIASKSWARFYAHTLDGTEANVNEANLRSILQYCKDNNVTVTTYKYLHDTFGTTVLEKRLSAIGG